MTAYFSGKEDEEPFKSVKDPEERKKLIQELHLLKTDIFMQLIESGAMPLRPGVKRLIDEAIESDVPVAVCSTSNERAVSTIVQVLLGPEIAAKMRVFAGDIVPKKKPDPAVYLLAAKELGVNPQNCCVVEDSRIGMQAAKAAGMVCLVTKSSYTQDEDFSEADGVYAEIGEKGSEKFTVNGTIKLLVCFR
ncbi:HAD-like domain-containing protein [Dunaliella salina]|uniref:HAD-like domain-containing protein n=1 Tax=Dunaliella salina TaxID=3046 RepID=A0ABQ7GNS5_DUNSA|nr:HAD-like domain-containing protein [Dunaliella salina]|eukprot:KAF5836265.1 HAD-like domain-containing protein [Dunaliella salina]